MQNSWIYPSAAVCTGTYNFQCLHDSLLATSQQATLTAPAARLALNVLGTILAVLPAGWLGAARGALAVIGTTPDQNMAVRQLLGSLGWAISQQGAPIHPRIVTIGGVSMTTGSATSIQLQAGATSTTTLFHLCGSVCLSAGAAAGPDIFCGVPICIYADLMGHKVGQPCQGDTVAPLCQRDFWGRGPRPSPGTTMPVWLDVHTRLSAGIDFNRGPLTPLLVFPSGPGFSGGNQTYPSR